MKKFAIGVSAFGFIFAAALNCAALDRKVPPPPAEAASGTPAREPGSSVTLDKATWVNVFVGHYGEALRFSADWTAEAEMRGVMEVVRFHARTMDTRKLVSPPYQPKPEEYVPGNFAAKKLAQLVIIPKNAPSGFASLRMLRAAKEKELTASGVGYTIQPPDYGDPDWPQDSFWVSISTPYQLYQQYSQSDKNIFIFTAGDNPSKEPGSYIDEIFNSLKKYLEPFKLQVSDDFLIYKKTFVLIPWLLICAIFGALGLVSERGGWRGRLRLIGRTTLFFSIMLPLIGWPLLYLGWRYGLGHWANRGSIDLSVALVMPLACLALSAWLGGRRIWRVFFWTAGINLLPADGYAHGST